MAHPSAKGPLPNDAEPRLVHIGEIRFDIGATSNGGPTPRGTFFYVPIVGGSFTTVWPLPEGFGIHSTATEGLRAEVLAGGSDYPQIHDNARAEIHVSVTCQGLNNPHVFRITSHGLCEWSELVWAQMTGAAAARSSAFGEVNSWQVFRINTDSPEYAWLNFACLIGQERLIYDDGRLAATHMKLFQFLVR